MLPVEFLNRMKEMLGSEYDDFLASYDRPPYQALRLNAKYLSAQYISQVPLHSAALRLSHKLSDEYGWTLSPVPWAENGFYYSPEDRPGRHVLHEAGAYYIQEPSAMAPVTYLDARPGMRVLDLCAAPGGKSTQIADAMQDRGLLISNEVVPSRAKILSENIERMGVACALVTNEAPDALAEHFPDYFDRILVDAPCSGEGMFRKNEEAAAEWSPENVRMCAARDDEILDAADRMLSPGGRMVFSTCTFEPEENEGSVYRFLTRHPDYHVLPVKKYSGMANGNPAWIQADYTLSEAAQSRPGTLGTGTEVPDQEILPQIANTIRLWPHRIAGEGHFLAVLKKGGTPLPASARVPLHGFEPGLKPKQLGEWNAFATADLTPEAAARITSSHAILRFGENLYAAPEGCPSLSHLKVLRPGLHLGTLKKGRFDPAYALSHALGTADVRHTVSLPIKAVVKTLQADDNISTPAGSVTDSDGAGTSGPYPSSAGVPAGFTAERWLNGETFRYAEESGWYLTCADGFSLSWGKLAGGTMKNHYPKGLRRRI